MNYEICKKEFIKNINNISHSISRYDVMRDFAELSRITIMNQMTPFYSQDAENRYLEIIRRYKKDEVNKICNMFGLVQLALNDHHGDFLGECLMSLEMGNHNIGQFFTPFHLCSLLAGINVTEPTEAMRLKGYFTISEPAAGGGGMIIAAHQQALSFNIDMFAHCVELSDMTADLCYINLSLAGVAGQVVQGNTLSGKMGRCMPTPALCSDVWHYRFKYECHTDEIADCIYATHDENESVNSGFKTMKDVLNVMGEPSVKCSERLFIYDDVAFSDYKVNQNET